MIIDKLFVLPAVWVAPPSFTYPLYLTACFGAFVSVFLLGGRIFTSPVVCVDGPTGLNEYCANSPLLLLSTNVHEHLHRDASWVLNFPLFAFSLAGLSLVIILSWRSVVETRLIEIHETIKHIVKDDDIMSNDLNNVRKSLWKYRQYNRFPVFLFFLLSFLAVLFILPLWYLLYLKSDLEAMMLYESFVPSEVVCHRRYIGPSGSMQTRDYLCTIVRADFLNLIYYISFVFGFFVSFSLLINLFFIFLFIFPGFNFFTISIIFRISLSKARKLVKKYSKSELFFFYLLSNNLFKPIFDELFEDYFYLKG